MHLKEVEIINMADVLEWNSREPRELPAWHWEPVSGFTLTVLVKASSPTKSLSRGIVKEALHFVSFSTSAHTVDDTYKEED